MVGFDFHIKGENEMGRRHPYGWHASRLYWCPVCKKRHKGFRLPDSCLIKKGVRIREKKVSQTLSVEKMDKVHSRLFHNADLALATYKQSQLLDFLRGCKK